MYSILIITRYSKWLGFFGFLSMMFFRLPLMMNKKIKFWKLMGSGKNGTFDIHPDFNQWAVLLVVDGIQLTGDKNFVPLFIIKWFLFFNCTNTIFILEPIEGHGLWDGKEVFGSLPRQTDYEGKIAVLTRATIRISRLKNFWKNVESVASKMAGAPGFISSYGIGEIPWVKQATFSIWESKAHMKNFAYKLHDHAEVIRKTRKENWYSEEMFVRFKVIDELKSL